MRKEDKKAIVAALTKELSDARAFYLTDAQGLDVATVNAFRREVHAEGMRYQVVKNTLLRKALSASSHAEEKRLTEVLRGFTGLLLPAEAAVAGARLLKAFRVQQGAALPKLKAAFVEETLYVGDEQLEALTKLKSKKELVADVVASLQSPLHQVVRALQGAGEQIGGWVQGLAQKKSKS